MTAETATPTTMPWMGRFPDCLTVEVTGRDIREGVQCDARACPIAQAVGHSLWTLGVRYVAMTVTRDDIMVIEAWGTAEVWYRHNGGQFVDRFDNGMSVTPFTVTLTRMRERAAA